MNLARLDSGCGLKGLPCPSSLSRLSLDAGSAAESGGLLAEGTTSLDGSTGRPRSSLRSQLSYIALTYLLSISMNIYNTYFFSKLRYNLGLPLFSTSVYVATEFGLASALLTIVDWRAGLGVAGSFRLLTLRQFFCIVVPCGVASGLSTALSNCSLQYISLSLYMIVKSTVPMFLLLFAFLFGWGETSWRLFAIVLLIGVGTMLAVWNAISFSLTGLLFVLTATVASGLRWNLIGLIINLRHHKAPHGGHVSSGANPLRTIVFLGPVICPTILGLSMVFEGPSAIYRSVFLQEPAAVLKTFCIYFLGGLQIFVLTLVEFKVVQETSALTFTILGIVKELVIIGVSVALFGDQLRWINTLGLSLTIGGILLYHMHYTDPPGASAKHRVEWAKFPAVGSEEFIRTDSKSSLLEVPAILRSVSTGKAFMGEDIELVLQPNTRADSHVQSHTL